MIRLHKSTRRNGKLAGKLALVISCEGFSGYILNVNGEIKKFHASQIAGLINESR